MKTKNYVVMALMLLFTFVLTVPAAASPVPATTADGNWRYFVHTGADPYISIVRYLGSDTAVEIPSTIDTLPVRELSGAMQIGGNAAGILAQTNVTSITIPSSVTTITRHALAYSKLTSLTIPNTVTKIERDAISNSPDLVSVTLPDNGADIDFSGMFVGCTSLTSFNLPPNLNAIPDRLFVGCSSLTSFTIPNTVTSIGVAAFSNSGIKTIVVPESVTYIAEGAFGGEALEVLVIPGSTSMYPRNFTNIPNATVYCTPGSEAHAIAVAERANYSFDNPPGLSAPAPATPALPSSSDVITVLVNGAAVIFDQPPVVQSGRTLVPLRAIFEALGANVAWEQSTQTVTATRGNTTVTLSIGSNILNRNGEQVTLDVPAQIVGGRTLVPARAVAESFGAAVGWDPDTRTVTITE
jgi:hypothetical protein